MVDENVVANGYVVIAKGTPVKAEVAKAKRAGRLGRGGRLSLQILGTTAVDGQPVPMQSTKGATGDNNTGSTIALTLLFARLRPLRHGEDMEFRPGQRFRVFSDAPVTVSVSS